MALLVSLLIGSSPVMAQTMAASVALGPDDLPPGFRLVEETGAEGESESWYLAFYAKEGAPSPSNPGPSFLIQSIYVSLSGDPIPEDAVQILLDGADPGFRQAPREFPGPPVGDAARWFRVSNPGSPAPDYYTVVFWVGPHVASLRMATAPEQADQFTLAALAHVVAERLAAL